MSGLKRSNFQFYKALFLSQKIAPYILIKENVSDNKQRQLRKSVSPSSRTLYVFASYDCLTKLKGDEDSRASSR